MVGLDRAALEDVGVDSALGEEADAVQLRGFLGEDVDEHLADDLALALGIGHARQLVEEAVDRVHVDEVGVHLVPEHPDHLLALAFAHEAVVDVHAGQLLADRLDEQGRDHRGVHAAAQRQQHLAVADLRAQGGDLLVDKGLGLRGRRDPRHALGTSVVCHSMPSCCIQKYATL